MDLTVAQTDDPVETRPGPHWRRRLGVLPRRALPILVTLAVVIVAIVLGRLAWTAYRDTPWTRDGTVRAYVITVKPEVSGRIVELPIRSDEFVHKGDPLMQIDRTDYAIALKGAQAAVEQAEANVENTRLQAERRQKLTNLTTSVEEQQTYEAQARIAQAGLAQASANLDRAKVNLERTKIVSPVNGFVTNLAVQIGDYATAGQRSLSIVDADSFWIDGYFEETQLRSISIGDPARISLMGYPTILHGHVAGISRGIQVANAQADAAGLATVNPIFTWIRLAQRVPVRIEIDKVPPDVTLSIGLTATVQIDRPPPSPP
ncbi:MAG TPA: HlyD family secretion protein [Reyranella sp.]|jgi:multidrug resistance efflux pump